MLKKTKKIKTKDKARKQMYKVRRAKDFKVLEAFIEANGGLGAVMGNAVKKNGLVSSVYITLKCAGRIFKAEGDTLEDALNKIKISGGIHKLGGVLTVEQGERKRTKILNSRTTNQLFGHVSNMAKFIALKQVKRIFP